MNAYHLHTVKTYADRWRSLRSWGAPVSMEIGVEPYKGRGALGLARSVRGMAMVYCTGNLARDLATAVHELAHLAAPNYVRHERPWREMFARAAAEIFECDSDDFDTEVAIGDLDAQVEDAARGWLEDQGAM